MVELVDGELGLGVHHVLPPDEQVFSREVLVLELHFRRRVGQTGQLEGFLDEACIA